MIASLRGVVERTEPGFLVVDVAGVGYGVHVTPQLALSMRTGDSVSVVTTTIVREDSITLFGFPDVDTARIFDALLGVTGVGPRSALAVMSQLSPETIVSAVAADDDTAFTRVNGIGPKTAKLICVQLAGKLPAELLTGGAGHSGASTPVDVVAALVGLGWSERQARDAVSHVEAEGRTTSDVLRDALAVLSS